MVQDPLFVPEPEEGSEDEAVASELHHKHLTKVSRVQRKRVRSCNMPKHASSLLQVSAGENGRATEVKASGTRPFCDCQVLPMRKHMLVVGGDSVLLGSTRCNTCRTSIVPAKASCWVSVVLQFGEGKSC